MHKTALYVSARRWTKGWGLHFGTHDVTQVRYLAQAEQQVRNYLDTIDPSTDHTQVSINLIPEESEACRTDATTENQPDKEPPPLASQFTQKLLQLLNVDYPSRSAIYGIALLVYR